MGIKTKIEYADSTQNFWYGCDKVSEGCLNCFAERMYKRFYGKDFSKLVKNKNFDAPLHWRKPRVILVNDMSDFFHKYVPFEWQKKAFEIILTSKQHIFLLLTKRPQRIETFISKFFRYMNECCPEGVSYGLNLDYFFSHIWLGVSVENQKTADERIPELLKIPHFKKWISAEPLLEEINISAELIGKKESCLIAEQIDWVVCGGETGKGARPMKAAMAGYLLDQCKSTSVPFFMKQMSGRQQIPKYLMVREYPKEIEKIRRKNG